MEPDELRRLLLERERQLELLDAEAGGETAPVELDQQRMGRLSRMDALQHQAMAGATAARRGAERRRVAQALTRLDQGEGGFCVECGEAIPDGRLAIDPAAERCVECAAGGA